MVMTEKQEGLGDSLRLTIERSDLTDALIDAGDMSLENITDVASGIPVLKWMTAAGKSYLTIRDYLFVRKLAAFLADLKSLPAEGRTSLIQRLDNEPAYSKRAAEALITVLDRVDSNLKAVWVAKALRAYAVERITAREMMRVNAVIERVLVCDVDEILAMLEKRDMTKHSDTDCAQSALVAGLATITQGYGGGGLVPTPVYRLFKEHVLDAALH
ncbi:hypothetical protein B0E50_11915 [Rhodanobacter sp. C01]|nr:hypothetical protein B0E50_11915 [Rhodanobacter sp. C01]